MTPDRPLVRLLDHDPDLGAQLSPERFAAARAEVVARVVPLRPGPFDPEQLVRAQAAGYGLLILEGLVDRRITVGGTAAMHLLGPGDLIAQHWDEMHESTVHAEISWTVLEPAAIALLDVRFLAAVRPWPEIVGALFERVSKQAASLGIRSAILQLPRVEDRVLAVLWYLAGRWGRVTTDGVLVPIALTHEMLGRLIGARRPTVSLALRRLEEAGRVRRGPRPRTWLLESDRAADAPASQPAPAAPAEPVGRLDRAAAFAAR